jgi:hypothetical protein
MINECLALLGAGAVGFSAANIEIYIKANRDAKKMDTPKLERVLQKFTPYKKVFLCAPYLAFKRELGKRTDYKTEVLG